MFAPSTAEAVRSTGGWLFDQVMAGWDVTVVITTDCGGDPRALHILGARVRDLDSVPASPALGLCLRAIGVRTDVYQSDPRVRQMVRTALEGGQADVRFWGDSWPDAVPSTADRVSHRLSLAARAFKAQAMAAAAVVPAAAGAPGVPAGRDAHVEVFRRGAIRQRALPLPGD